MIPHEIFRDNLGEQGIPAAATRSTSSQTLGPAGSLDRLGGNILLVHVTPHLGLNASLNLAATSHFYRTLLLHDTLARNVIPARLLQTRHLPSSALAAIRHIKIDSILTFTDLAWILEGEMLLRFTSLTISHNLQIPRALIHLPLIRLHTLSVCFATMVDFLADPASAAKLRGLRCLTLEYKRRSQHPQDCPPENLLRALGPASELIDIAISTNSPWVSDGYHSAVLALLDAFSVPGSAPPNLKLVSLAFNDLTDNGNDLPSVIVAAWKSSLEHVKSPWRLGHLPAISFTSDSITEDWLPGYGPTKFTISEKELNALLALNHRTWDGSLLRDFFTGPVHVPANVLAHIGPLGTALEGIEVDMSCDQAILPIFNPSVKYISLDFSPNKTISANPQPLLLGTSPWLKSLELSTDYYRSQRLVTYPRIYETIVLPAMPSLTTFRADVRLFLRAGERRKCGLSQTPHAAARYQLEFIPKHVPKLRLDGWTGCSTCWRDCRVGTLRHFIVGGAGGAGRVTVRGVFCLFGETEEGVGCEELWELRFMTPEDWQRYKV